MSLWDVEKVEISAILIKETHGGNAAYLIADGREDEDGLEIKTWVPKSQVEYDDMGTFTMPEWLAKNEGFI